MRQLGTYLQRVWSRQSESIRGNQRPSEAIRGNQRQIEARVVEAIRPHQRQLGAIEPSSIGNQEAIKTLTRRHRAVINRQSGGNQDTYSAPSSRHQ
jgi:hypothetical protein